MSFNLNGLEAQVQAHGAVVRVLVAGTKGSAPRDAGATMLVWKTGQSGTIGGGALEHQACLRAPQNPDANHRCHAHHPTAWSDAGPMLRRQCDAGVGAIPRPDPAPQRKPLFSPALLRKMPVPTSLPCCNAGLTRPKIRRWNRS